MSHFSCFVASAESAVLLGDTLWAFDSSVSRGLSGFFIEGFYPHDAAARWGVRRFNATRDMQTKP